MIRSTKNKLWVFGDSFSEGSGCNPGQPYYIFSDPKKKWNEIIADELNLDLVREARGGISTLEIINHLVRCLHEIKKGDYVIVGDTLPTRLIGVSQRKKYMDSPVTPLVTFNNDVLFKSSGINSDVFYGYDIQPENLETYVDYVYSFVYKYSENWERFYRNQILNIFKDLKTRRDVECYFWSSRIWSIEKRYESISEATNDKISDDHWSWVGHEQMAEYIMSRVKERKYIDETEWVNSSWLFHNDKEGYKKYNQTLL